MKQSDNDAAEQSRKSTDAISEQAKAARFIMGMSRAGTNWMARCLNEHSAVVVFGETSYWGKHYVEPDASGLYQEEHLDAVFAHLYRLAWDATLGSTPGEQSPGRLKRLTLEGVHAMLDRLRSSLQPPLSPAELFLKLGEAFAQEERKTIAIEKTPHHVNWPDRIFSAYPAAKAVVHIRDPYSFMLSYKHQGDRWRPASRKRFKQLYHPIGCALVWKGYARSCLAALERYPDNCIVVRYEDIQSNPHSVLAAVQRHFNLQIEPLAERVPRTNSSFATASRPPLSRADIFWMNVLAGSLITKAKYHVRRAGVRSVLSVSLSLLRLPLWAARCYMHMSKTTSGSTMRYILRWLGVYGRRPAAPCVDDPQSSPKARSPVQ